MEMANVGERVSVVETQIKNIDEKLDELQVDIREIHECVENNKKHIVEELKTITAISAATYQDIDKKISDLENFKNKWYYIVIGSVSVIAFFLGHSDIARQFFS